MTVVRSGNNIIIGSYLVSRVIFAHFNFYVIIYLPATITSGSFNGYIHTAVQDRIVQASFLLCSFRKKMEITCMMLHYYTAFFIIM